jgi:hypothetical protein
MNRRPSALRLPFIVTFLLIILPLSLVLWALIILAFRHLLT